MGEEEEVKNFWKSNHNVLAIDPSLRSTGICYKNRRRGEVIWEAIKIKHPNQIVALRQLYTHLDSLTYSSQTDLVVVEGPSFASRGNASVTMGMVHGISQVVAYAAGAVLVVPPTMWKKMVFGKGNVPKEDHKVVAYKMFDLEFDTLDECDATMLYILVKKGLIQGKWKKKPSDESIEALKQSLLIRRPFDGRELT